MSPEWSEVILNWVRMRGQYISAELQATILTARWFSRTDSLVRKSIPHTCKIGKLLFGPHNHIQSGARSRSYIDGFLMWNTSWKIGENSEFVVVHISQWISEFQNVSKPPKTSSNLPWKLQVFKRFFEVKILSVYLLKTVVKWQKIDRVFCGKDWHFSSVCSAHLGWS